jgi:conjugative transfer region lipoprotein (TIGR03751 family)
VAWINGIRGIALWVMAGALLTGCATQDTILPTAERPMIDIYREAMNEQTGETLVENSQAICTDLDLDEPVQECEKTLQAHAKAQYSVIDTGSKPQALDYIPYTREQRTEIENLFPRLTNPDVVIYVYPHLATRTRAPIPGYTTVIPLYDRVEYRLPGEDLAETPLPSVAVDPEVTAP